MKEYIITAFDFQETIDLDPFRAEDVPELIRCKDCKHYGKAFNYCYCDILNRCANENWFCADGRRKDD